MPTLGLHVATTQPFWRVPDEVAVALERALPAGWELDRVDDPARLAPVVRRATVMVGWPFPAALARRATALRWVHFFTAGVPESWTVASTRHAIDVTCAGGVNADSVAEHALFLVMAGLRGLRAGSLGRGWDPEAFDIARAPGALTATVIGHGAVGRRLARLLVPLFGEVRVVVRTARPVDPGVEMFTVDRLADALRGAWLVALAVPLSTATRALLADMWAMLSADVCVVNLSRGALVDEQALLAFLAANPRSRYLTDVAHPEPYAPELPLWTSDRVLITPHIAGRREDAWTHIGDQTLALVAERLERLA